MHWEQATFSLIDTFGNEINIYHIALLNDYFTFFLVGHVNIKVWAWLLLFLPFHEEYFSNAFQQIFNFVSIYSNSTETYLYRVQNQSLKLSKGLGNY